MKEALIKYTDFDNLSKEEKKFLRRDLVYSKIKYNVSYMEYFLYNFKEKNHFQKNSEKS